MRHLVKGKKLSRTTSHRKATLSSLATALIQEHRIVTTVPKAKELRRYVEPLITKAKEDTSHNRRQVFSKLNNKEAVSQLFEEVAKKAMDRPGGYTRVVKAGFRQGDGAEMAVIELVDYNDIKPDRAKKKKTRRAGKSKKVTSSTKKSKEKDSAEESKKKEQDEAKAEAAGKEEDGEKNEE